MKLQNIFGYRDLVKMDEPVCTNSMCYELGRLYQGRKKHSGTDIIEFILHKDKPQDREKHGTSDNNKKTHIKRHTAG